MPEKQPLKAVQSLAVNDDSLNKTKRAGLPFMRKEKKRKELEVKDPGVQVSGEEAWKGREIEGDPPHSDTIPHLFVFFFFSFSSCP